MSCSVHNCDGKVHAGGLCSKHYNRRRMTGTTYDGPRAKRPLDVRFWSNVRRGSDDKCWPWVGKSKSNGYGIIGLGSRAEGKMVSNRVVWTLTHGEIPKGLVVRHLCHNRLCCNPKHLALGTLADNVADMWKRRGGPKGNARLTKKQVTDIRSDPRSSRELAPIYGVSDAHIRSIRQERCWKPKR
jgi:hypothetical protein